nr:hypothetical protein [Porphyropsis coccinea]
MDVKFIFIVAKIIFNMNWPKYYILSFIEINYDHFFYTIINLENCINKNRRIKGLGLKILYYSFQYYINQAAYSVMLETHSSNNTSLNLYYYYKFQIVFKRNNYYKISSENCLILANTSIMSINFSQLKILIRNREQ